MKSRAGPKLKRSVANGLPPSWIGSALISTLLSIKNASKLGSTKEGSVVAKVLTVLGGRLRGVDPRSLAVWDSPLDAAPFWPAGG